MKRFGRWLVGTWKGRCVLTLLLLLVVGVGRHVWYRYQAEASLRAALDDLDRREPGWRLADLEAARRAVPEAENSAPVIAAAARHLDESWPEDEFNDLFKDLEPQQELTEEQAVALRWELRRLQPALTEARKLIDKPEGRHPIQYSLDPYISVLPHVFQTRRVARLLVYDGWLRTQNGDRRGAVESCRAVFHAARSLGDEPTIVGQTRRAHFTMEGCRLAERILAQGELEPGAVEQLQRLVEREEKHPFLHIMIRGHRAVTHELFTAVVAGDPAVKKFDPPWFYSRWYLLAFGLAGRTWIHGEHPRLFLLTREALDALKLPELERVAVLKAMERQVGLEHPNWALATTVLPMWAGNRVTCRLHAHLRCLKVALAAERYRLKHGNWPNGIEPLVPDLLAAVPIDPFDGQPVRYRQTDTGLTIYSVGPDGEDNLGRLDPNGEEPGSDLGVRLFRVRPLVKAPRPRIGPPWPPDDDVPIGPPPTD
jgi:hypothetical protein